MLYNIIVSLIIFVTKLQCQTLPPNEIVESNLVKLLFTTNGYNKNIRPDDQVQVAVSIQLKQIISLDEKNQILTTTCYFEQWWTDGRLTWTPGSYNNIQVIIVPLKNMWLPDTIVMNSADGDGYLKINSDFGYLSILYTGEIYYVSPVIALKTRCYLDMQSYPFDSQQCNIRIASWSNGDNRIYYSVNDSYIDQSDYTNNSIWNLVVSEVQTNAKSDRSPFEDTKSTEIVAVLYLQRKPLFYMMNSIFPCLILNLVTLLTFFMPASSASGIG